MRRPEMILFDYGQTLVAEQVFDGIKGTAAVMEYAVSNPHGYTPAEVQAEAEKIILETGRFSSVTEIHNRVFNNYLYGSMGIKIDLEPEEYDRIFWDAAAPGKVTEGLESFLEYLWEKGIRTAVLSNIGYSGAALEERIGRMIPSNHFEFIIATSEYLFRKPYKRIFDLALKKADLKAEDVWFVGDNPVCDIDGARDAGMTPVWYKAAMLTATEDRDDVLKITDWNELRDILEGL